MLCLPQVPDLVVHEEEVYDDDDDENEESNWRNDYPDEESDGDSDREERYGGMHLSICLHKISCTGYIFRLQTFVDTAVIREQKHSLEQRYC